MRNKSKTIGWNRLISRPQGLILSVLGHFLSKNYETGRHSKRARNN